ncbi:bleomycin resistance protein [Chitinophaga nivalis]|uniref:VOC family protein n=1 Tax=Chitinophaga nivalis TaxID=2991709 RepID=A0ABT3IKN8_9BACT|nr:VOC family protein [Chitinophaga nivalis]MCW3465934.1 VOC family protein [Chitinophaga nivalis]MCW3484375.1 VOC family protein [Chitinophaga nivalis]
MKEYAIPMLPSTAMKETLAFYTAMGFVITYQQQAPNTYVCMKIRDIELHFFSLKQIKPESNFSTCYLIVDNIDLLFQSFTAGLKEKLGKVPVKGIPRINPLKDMPSYGVRQFVVVDPSGNYIRIGQPIKKEQSLLFEENGQKPMAGTPLQKAYELGNRLANGKDDIDKAAKVLDAALQAADETDLLHLFKVVSLRIDIADRQNDTTLIAALSIKGKELLTKITDHTPIEADLQAFEKYSG